MCNQAQVKKQEEGCARRLLMMGGWVDEGGKAFSICWWEEQGV